MLSISQRNVCNVTSLDLQGPSRLPQPEARQRRHSIVSKAPEAGLPAIDFDKPVAGNQRSSSRKHDASRIPIPKLVTKANNHFRPKTTAATTVVRHKTPGRGHLLQKLHALSLGQAEEDSKFARFQPLPAIGLPTKQLYTTDCSVCDGELDFMGHYYGYPTSTDCNDSYEDYFNKTDDGSSKNECKQDNEASDGAVDDNILEPEESMNSYDKPAMAPLVRSRTYDILPLSENLNTTTRGFSQKGKDDKSHIIQHDDSEVIQTSYDHAAGLLFAIRVPTDEQIYGYFQESDVLQTVMDFACKMTRRDFSNYKLLHIDNHAMAHELDLTQTILEAKMKNRTILQIVKNDSVL